MGDLSGSAITQRSIDVYGITGEFTVLKQNDEQPIKVKYFQTVASNRVNNASGNANDLLAELKPMRERVNSEDLKDLRSLLQRDLSDYRVANDLVPYLQGRSSIVGFFPSILVALMPKGFLKGGHDAMYPRPEEISSSEKKHVKYDDFWNVENFKMGESFVSLARLSVNPVDTDFIVLDGQHRANAFRYLAGAFDDATDDSSIYSVFYQDCGSPEPSSFNAELPVTIVWFEGESGVPSSLISRKLFVDVNTTAKKVSESRNILLNDTELASICVTSFYSKVAELGYNLDSLSLMHTGFDCEGKFPSEFPKMTLFSPKTLHYMLSYFLLAVPRHMDLGNKIGNDSYGNFGTFHERLKDLCEGVNDELISKVTSGDSEALMKIDKIFKDKFINKLYKVINNFIFLKSHFSACKNIDKIINGTGAAERIGAWNKIFRGGEGLYNAFNQAEFDQGNLTGRIQTYKVAVDDINKEFTDLRSESLDGYDVAFASFSSQAGLTGFFMALESSFEIDGWSDDLIEKFLSAINSYTAQEWVIILTEYKRGVQLESSPKLWPSMREIFLRFIELKEESWTFFSKSTLHDFHPDYIFCKNIINEDLKGFHRSSPDEKPNSKDIDDWVSASVSRLKECLDKLSVKTCDEKLLRQKLNDFTEKRIDAFYPEEE